MYSNSERFRKCMLICFATYLVKSDECLLLEFTFGKLNRIT